MRGDTVSKKGDEAGSSKFKSFRFGLFVSKLDLEGYVLIDWWWYAQPIGCC